MQLDLSAGKRRRRQEKGKGPTLHRCRFVDWRPSPISCLALSPDLFQVGLLDVGGSANDRELLAVGRSNGDVELMTWGGHQGWIHYRTLPCPFSYDNVNLDSRKRPFSMVTHLVWTHQVTLSESDLSLFEGDRPGAERELARLKRQSLRLFGVGGPGKELVEWEWGAPGASSRYGQVKAVLPSLPPILSLAASPSGAHLAVGCEDSTIRIINVLDGEFDVVAKIEVGGAGKVRPTSIAFAAPTSSSTASGSAATSEASTSRAASPDTSVLPDSFATPRETAIIVGCSDSTIRRFQAPEQGSISAPWRQSLRMTVDRLKGEHTVVWTVAIAADGTIVSGDSMGNVKFWDPRMGTQLQTYKAHRADVLALAVGSNGRNVFTSGVDQKVVEFKLVQITKVAGEVSTSRWIEASGRRIHSHDVQAMVVSPSYSATRSRLDATPVLTSGGVDLGLAIVCVANKLHPPNSTVPYPNVVSDVPSASFESTNHRKASYAPQRPNHVVQLAPRTKLVVWRRSRSVGIWRAGKSNHANDGSLTSNGVGGSSNGEQGTEDWTKLLEIELKLQTNLVASAISCDGSWLAVSDLFETKLFKLSFKAGELHAKRIKDCSASLSLALPGAFGTGSSCLEFTPDGSRLVLATAFGSTVAIVALPSSKGEPCRVEATFDARSKAPRPIKGFPSTAASASLSDDDEGTDGDSDQEMEDALVEADLHDPTSVITMALSSDCKWLACATLNRRVVVYDLEQMRLVAVLPTCKTPPTAIAFAVHAAPRTGQDDDEEDDEDTPFPWLVTGYADNSVDVFDLETLHAPEWAAQLSSPDLNRLMDYREPISGLVVRNKSVAAVEDGQQVKVSIEAHVWAANWIAKIDLTSLERSELAKKELHRNGKRRRRESGADVTVEQQVIERSTTTTQEVLDIPVNRKYSPILLFDYVSGKKQQQQDEAVVVERVWRDVVQDLPPAFARFGEFGS